MINKHRLYFIIIKSTLRIWSADLLVIRFINIDAGDSTLGVSEQELKDTRFFFFFYVPHQSRRHFACISKRAQTRAKKKEREISKKKKKK